MSSARRRVAVLGATGHVGKCIVAGLLDRDVVDLTAVARNQTKLADFLALLQHGSEVDSATFGRFPTGDYDVVINCVGAGDPVSVARAGASIASLTEEFDSLVTNYSEARPHTQYVYISSGAAYCHDFETPASDFTSVSAQSDCPTPPDAYVHAKRATELRHRERPDEWIIDLRLFGLFSRWMDPATGYFMADVVRALLEDKVLEVSTDDMVRDYVDPTDLAGLLVAVMDAPEHNAAYDVFSAGPVSKFEVLDSFSERYGLRYESMATRSGMSTGGAKTNYYSTSQRAGQLGYEPVWTSLASLHNETDAQLAAAGRSLPAK